MKVMVNKNSFCLIERCDNILFKRYLDVLKNMCNGRFIPAPINMWIVDDKYVNKAKEMLTNYGFKLVEINDGIDYSKLVYARWRDGYYCFRCIFKNDVFNYIFRNKLSALTEFDEQTFERKTISHRLAMEIIEKLTNEGFIFHYDESFENAMKADEAKLLAFNNIPEKLKNALNNGITPFPHQNMAFDFIERCNGNAILGCCMGSGKTFMSLSYAAANNLRTLVICPKIVRRNWILEAKRFFKFFDSVLEIKTKKDLSKIDKNTKLVSLNYEFITRHFEDFKKYNFDILIIDESHYIKNPKSKRCIAVTELSKNIKRKILLSGTIVKNGREELLPQINILGNEYVPRDFWLMPLGKLWHSLQNFYLSMPKHEILSFLPPKIQRKIELEVENPIPAPTSIEQVTEYKHLSAKSKINIAIEFIDDWLESSDDDDAMLVFSEFIDVIDTLYEKYSTIGLKHTGKMTQEQRERIKTSFQSGNAKILFATRQSLAVGANLTRANKILFVDLPWTPADIEQAEDRAHRIGQISSVQIDWLVAANSEFDSKLIDILFRKMKLSKAICEGRNLTDNERKLVETSTENLLAEAFGLK
ncbi:MAG: DEAD/DEAH box helicase [Candidatus Bilamarchaeaceae archaeon]